MRSTRLPFSIRAPAYTTLLSRANCISDCHHLLQFHRTRWHLSYAAHFENHSISKSGMKLCILSAALAASPLISCHTVFTTLFINDIDQGDGTCTRMPMTPSNATYPVNDLSSNDMACGEYFPPIFAKAIFFFGSSLTSLNNTDN